MDFSLGKIETNTSDLVDAIEAGGFLEPPVRGVHTAGVASLPLHHTDPPDRLLLAQAIAEPIKLLTVDKVLAKYSDLVVIA